MIITTSHTVRPLTKDEHCDLNLNMKRENFMERCQLYHGNKLKIRNKTMSKVETVLDDDNDIVTHTYFPDKPADKTTMPEQDVIDDDAKPIQKEMKEMKNMGVAFDILKAHGNVPVVWTKASGHLIWDVKMDFTRKSR